MDLGKSLDNKFAPPAAVNEVKGKKYYPSVHISDIKGLDKLPDGEFEFTGKGRVVSMTHNKKAGICSCELEILELEAGEESDTAEDGLEKALKGKEEAMAVEVDDDEEETE